MIYPHLFHVDLSQRPEDRPGNIKYIVIIAHSDLRYVNTDWIGDPDLPDGYCFRPAVDLVRSKHIFDTELDALKFIKKWWAQVDFHLDYP